MSRTGLVSVTIPFLDSERFLADAVESVLAQTYGDWELFLVDDGSTDRSTRIAKDYESADPDRIHYLEHPGHENRGMPATRNLGLAHSAGEFVARLDSDDRWEPTHLEVQVGVMRAHPDVAMTFGPMRVWYEWDEASGKGDWVQEFTFSTDERIEPPRLVPHLLSGRNDPQGALVRRTEMDAVGGYDESIDLYEDMTLYCKIASLYPTYPYGRCTYHYRRHPDSYCAHALSEGRLEPEQQEFLDWFEDWLGKAGLDDTGVSRALDRARWRSRHPRIKGLLELPRRVGRALSRRGRRGGIGEG